jgi:hypothetical protein
MSEEIEALKDAIHLSREKLLEDILAHLKINEIDESVFQVLIEVIEKEDEKRFKYSKALESQEVIEYVLKNKLE